MRVMGQKHTSTEMAQAHHFADKIGARRGSGTRSRPGRYRSPRPEPEHSSQGGSISLGRRTCPGSCHRA